jgi:hypothetical protein
MGKWSRLSNWKKRPPALTSDDGITCLRCGGQTERRTHAVITAELLEQPYYYRQWFYCHDADCKTRLIMRDEDRVFTETGRRLIAIKAQLRPRA